MQLESGEIRTRIGAVRATAGWAAGVVDKDLHRTQITQRFNFCAQRALIAHIDRDKRMLLRGMCARQCGDGGFKRIVRTCEQGDIGAEQREFMPCRAADTLRAAADQGVFAGEIEIHAVSRDADDPAEGTIGSSGERISVFGVQPMCHLRDQFFVAIATRRFEFFE